MEFKVTILCRCKITVPINANSNAKMCDLSEAAIQEIVSSKYPNEDLTYIVSQDDILSVEEISFKPKKA